MTERSEFIIVVIVLLLALSALFSSSETALTGFSRARLLVAVRRGSKRARTVLDMTRRMDTLIAGVLVGNNVVNIFASALATGLFIEWFGGAGIFWATLTMTLSILFLSEILPKSIAIREPTRAALVIGPLMRPLLLFLALPMTVFLLGFKALFRIAGFSARQPNKTREASEELIGAIHIHRARINREHGDMLLSILNLGQIPVSAVMTHRRNVEMVSVSSRYSVDSLGASRYTRLPVYENDRNNIIGILHARDVLRRAKRADSANLVRRAMARPWFVPSTTTLRTQLEKFRARREHMACVIDEYGVFLGVVTLEDVLEHIVGEIHDEHDFANYGIEVLNPGEWIIEGSVAVRMLNRNFGWTLPEERAVTIGGLVSRSVMRIPRRGQVFLLFGFRIQIVDSDEGHIVRLRMRSHKASRRSKKARRSRVWRARHASASIR